MAELQFSHPTEPQCSYDPVDGLNLAPETDPLSKIKELEDQICTDWKRSFFDPHTDSFPSLS